VVVQDGVFLVDVQAEGVISVTIIFDDLGLLFDEVSAVVVEPLRPPFRPLIMV
jgi:hypothetical protein